MNIKTLLKSRRGVAIELAVGVMFLMMAFTIMLLSTAGLQTKSRDKDYADFKNYMEVGSIGEYVASNYTAYQGKTDEQIIIGEGENAVTTDYSVSGTSDASNIKLTITKTGETEPVLTIELDADGKITSWK